MSGKTLFSRTQLEIILFFYQNPTSIDTARGISAWINEDAVNVRKALTDLVKKNILIAHKVTSTTGYSYTRDIKILKGIKCVMDEYQKKRRRA